MKRNTIWAMLVGVFLALLLVLVAVRVFFPEDVVFGMISMYVFIIALWLYIYRILRKPKA
jgi:hypothetical protein